MKTSTTSFYSKLLVTGLQESFSRYQEAWSSFQELESFELKKATTQETAEFIRRKEVVQVNRISVYLFAASYLESLINLYLVQNLNEEEFSGLEKLSPIEKWVLGPRFIDKGYSLKKGVSPHQELKELFSRRNAIMHHKPYHEVDGEVINKGTFPQIHQNEHSLTSKIFNLPSIMVHYILDNDKVSDTFSFAICSGLDHQSLIEKFNTLKDRKQG